MATSAALERDRAVINQIAVRFTDAAGVAPNIASVILGYTIPEPQPGATQGHTRQAQTRVRTGRLAGARKTDRLPRRDPQAELAGQ